MTQEEMRINVEALKIHEQRILDSKIQQAANDLWSVELEVNRRHEKWSLIAEQVGVAADELVLSHNARTRFMQHRNLKEFQEELKK